MSCHFNSLLQCPLCATVCQSFFPSLCDVSYFYSSLYPACASTCRLPRFGRGPSTASSQARESRSTLPGNPQGSSWASGSLWNGGHAVVPSSGPRQLWSFGPVGLVEGAAAWAGGVCGQSECAPELRTRTRRRLTCARSESGGLGPFVWRDHPAWPVRKRGRHLKCLRWIGMEIFQDNCQF